MSENVISLENTEIQVKKPKSIQKEFDKLVKAERPKLLKIAAGMLGSLDEAEDAVQDSLLRLFQKWDSADNKPAYLYRILSNACFDRLRTRAKQETAQPVTQSEETNENTDAHLAVRSALETLNPQERAALLLKEVEKLCYKDIAEVLEATVAQVTNWIHRGKNALREQLKPHFGREVPK